MFETDEDHSYFLIRLPVHEDFSIAEETARVSDEVTDQATHQVTHLVWVLLAAVTGEMNRADLMAALALKDRVNFRTAYLEPALALGLIEMTQPDSPRSPTQKYRLTTLGKQVLARTEGRI